MATTERLGGRDACIAENTVLAFLAGELGGDGLRHVEEHLDGCVTCRHVIAVACARGSGSVRASSVPLGLWQSRAELAGLASAMSAAWPCDHAELLGALRPVAEDEYVVERELARGGMGRILLALDRHGRRVALKVLLSHDASSVGRFVREMQVTARLQHPSIITLHEAGRWPSGEPFFAMRLVEGRSLRDELAALPALKDRVALVSRLVAVTDALAYAHDRGIIHRDLKPANILVGAYGETVVIDWGLAKVRSAPHDDGPRRADTLAEPALADVAATEGGVALGTPAYMAPEQALGCEIDERVDVYGLGALLYHVLCGQAPYSGSSQREVLKKLLTEQPPPLEQRVPEVPPDLAAIVRKAMMRIPSARYPSAKEMADDLRRFSAGQLVSVHAYTLGALLRRWVRKYRAAVWVGLTLLLLGAVGSVLSIRRIVEAGRRADAERQVASAHRDAAERLVEFLIDDFRQRVVRVDRLDLLQGLGAEVRKYYEGVERSGAPASLESLPSRAKTLAALGEIEFEKRDLESARPLYRQAIELWTKLDAARALASDELVQLGRVWQRSGVLEHVSGNLDVAIDAHRHAVELAERVPESDAEYLDGQLLAGANERRLCETFQRKGDLDASFDACRAALARLDPLLPRHPHSIELTRTLALINQTLSDRELLLGRLSDASHSILRSVELFEAVLREDPHHSEVAREHAYAHLFVSTVQVADGQLEAALAAMRTFLARYADIRRADPGNRATEEDMAVGYSQDCDLQRRALRLDQAESACANAITILQRHVGSSPGSQKSQRMLAWALVERGRVEMARGDAAAAREPLLAATQLARRFFADNPDAGQEDLAIALGWLAQSELARRDTAAGRDADEAASLARQLAAGSPSSADLQNLWAHSELVSGDVKMAQGRLDDARAAYQTANDTFEAILRRSPGVVDYEVAKARAEERLAAAYDGPPNANHASRELRERAQQRLAALERAGRLYPEDESVLEALRASLGRNARAALPPRPTAASAEQKSWHPSLPSR